MPTTVDQVADLVFGRWRSQILFAGTELGLFDRLSKETPRQAPAIASELGVDSALLYRLLRAEAAIGLLAEDASQGFVLTDMGDLLRAAHPQSLRAMTRLEEGPQHYAIWEHLPAMIRDGRQNAFRREFGSMAFDHAKHDPDYDERFKQAMSSYSALQSGLVLEALHGRDLSSVRSFCDVAGGYGFLMCELLRTYPHMSGIVFELPEVVADHAELLAPKQGLADRCRYIGGDMFQQIPAADAYSLKMILHDWNDHECVEILSNIRKSAPGHARIFIIEHVVPSHDVPHFAKLFDIHMMCWGTGRERTETEYSDLLDKAGWQLAGCHYPASRMMGVIEGVRT